MAHPRFKRTAQFTPEDFDLLVRLIGRSARVITLPNILTEVSNLAGQLAGPARASCFAVFARGVEALEEHYVESRSLVGQPRFPHLGLTDVGLLEVARGRFLLLTDDFRLAQTAAREGVEVVNFNHLRWFDV